MPRPMHTGTTDGTASWSPSSPRTSDHSTIGDEYDSERARVKLERVFAHRNDFPPRLRECIDRALRDYHPTHPNTPPPQEQQLLARIEGRLSDLLWENHTYQKLDPSKGLNVSRDTEAQVETALRFFPRVLCATNEDGLLPIRAQVTNKRQVCNVQAVPFVPVMARVGIESGVFADWERGGLVDTNDDGNDDGNDEHGNHYSLYWNVLEALAIGQHHATYPGKERLRAVDETCLAVLQRLRVVGLFRKRDIGRYHLVHRTVSPGLGLLEGGFRWLVDWDPASVLVYWKGSLPIHHAAYDYTWHSINRERFRTIFAVGLEKFPTEMGGLFHKDANGITPYRRIGWACGREALEVVFAHLDNSVDALLECLVFAASEPRVHLDGVLLALQRVLELVPSVLYSRVGSGNASSDTNTNTDANPMDTRS